MVIEPLIKNYNNVVDEVYVIPNYRTDGRGRTDNDSRLISLSNLIHMFSLDVFNSINLLHDHKGILTVYLDYPCKEFECLCTYCWEFFGESEIEFEYINEAI